LSDRAEIFTTDTLEVGPEVKLTVFNFDLSIRIYRDLKTRPHPRQVLLRIFIIKKEESEIFENAQNYLWRVTIGNCTTIFSRIGQNLIGVFLGRMKNPRFSKNRQKKPKTPGKNFSSNTCPIILDVLFVVKNSIDSVAPSSRFENRQKEGGGVPLSIHRMYPKVIHNQYYKKYFPVQSMY